jgi:hypothetical protein
MGKPQGSRGLAPQEAPIVFTPPEVSARYSDTSGKLQYFLPVLDGGNLLAELVFFTTTTDLNVSLVKSEMRDKAGVNAVTFTNNWSIGIEVSKSTRPVTIQRGIIMIIHPSFTKWYKTNDRQL